MWTFCNGNVAGEFPTETIIALPGIQHKTLMKINISQFCRRLNADLFIYGSEAISRDGGCGPNCSSEGLQKQLRPLNSRVDQPSFTMAV